MEKCLLIKYNRVMLIPEEYFIFINIAIILIYVIFAVSAYRKGLLLQLISLTFNILSIFAAWFLAPILATRFPLVHVDKLYNSFDVTPLANSFVYFVILFLIFKIIYLFIKPLFKSVSKIPLVGALNKMGGFLVGLINATIVVLLLSLLLDTALIKNGKEVKENTIFKYTETLSNKAVELTVKHINVDALKDYIDNFNADEARGKFTEWLIDQGILNE